MERLQKFMADCGVGSRRKCEQYIKSGRVSVDGIIVTEMGVKIEPSSSVILFDGVPICAEKNNVYIALNKPVGYITSSNDQFGRPTVLDLTADIKERIYPVGRLDYNSSGLIFLTNDGGFAYRLTHPKHSIRKKYLVKLDGHLSRTSVKLLEDGVYLDEGAKEVKTHPCAIEVLSETEENTELYITISEGRNRQVRRMFESVGHTVVSLHRVAIGSVEIGDLKSGELRLLTSFEIVSFEKAVD